MRTRLELTIISHDIKDLKKVGEKIDKLLNATTSMDAQKVINLGKYYVRVHNPIIKILNKKKIRWRYTHKGGEVEILGKRKS